MNNISNITALISNLRAETQKDAITPESLGALLQALVNLLYGTATTEELSSEANSRSSADAEILARIVGNSKYSSAYSDPQIFLGSFNAQDYGSIEAAWAAVLEKLDGLSKLEGAEAQKYVGVLNFTFLGQLFKVFNFVTSWADHCYLQYIFGTSYVKSDGTLASAHTTPSVCVRYTKTDGTGDWNPWTDLTGSLAKRVPEIENQLNAIVEKAARGTMYHAKGLIPLMIDLSQIDSVPGITTSSQMTKANFPMEYIITSMGYPMGTLFIFGDSMGHAVTQVIVTHSNLDANGSLSANHGQALHIYYRRFNITTHHGTAGEWTPWQDFVSPDRFASLTRNVLDLGSFESEDAALVAAKLTNVSADASVTLIRFSWDSGKKNGFVLQQVGSQVDQNICDTYQFYSYGGRCWYRLIQWYYADDGKGHKARDFYTATTWKSPFGNTLAFNPVTLKLQLLGWKGEVVSEVEIPNDSPSLQTAWNTGTESSYIYSKPWANGADNSKTVLAVGSHVAQHGGKLKMRYIFWGGGSGAAYGNEVPVATATCDGAMAAADKAALDDIKNNRGSYVITLDTGYTVTTEQISAIKEAFNNGRGVMVVIPSAGLKFQAAFRQKTDQDHIYLSGCVATTQDGFQLAFAKINILSHAVTFTFKNI